MNEDTSNNFDDNLTSKCANAKASIADKQLSILVADDDLDILAALKLLLSCENYRVTLASHPEQALTLFKENSFDAVLLDLNFQQDTTSGEEGLQLLEAMRAIEPNTPLIVMTGWANISIAISSMQKGANDFIEKPWENERVLSILATQIKLAQQHQKTEKLSQENQLLKSEKRQSAAIISYSPIMKNVLKQIEQIAQSDVSILLTGENGTGKSLFAEYIHQLSSRDAHSLISVNMGAIPENLFESEMFGHVKGAFTDAKAQRIGRFELADQGSLFLDEIGNIPLSQQSKLLRVLESQHFEKVGASKTLAVDTRVISATNADINSLIQKGEFRQDLFYRLKGIEIQLPPLRARTEDILPIAETFLKKYQAKYQGAIQGADLTFSNSAKSALLAYPWPGNIRELNHMVERAVILADSAQINVEQLALSANNSVELNNAAKSIVKPNEALPSLAQLEQQIIEQRIQHHQGNMQNTAKSLGLSRSAFYRRIDKFQQ